MIELVHITKKYDDLVFEDVNINIPDKGLTFIYGKSGCGKSTFLNIIAGLDEVYDGNVIVDGEKYISFKERTSIRYSKIAYMNQKDDLVLEMTVKENIEWIKSLSNSSYDVNCFFEKFQLKDIENHYPHELSGGELSLICLLKNILLNRKYILLDEPNAKLDSQRKIYLNELLLSLSENYSIIVVSHDMDFIDIADTIFHFEHKRVIARKVDELLINDNSFFNSPSFPLVKLFLNNVKYYGLRYLFSIFIFTMIICYSYTFFNMGNTLFSQIQDIINEKSELYHIEATALSIDYNTIEKIKKEPFIEQIDYSFNILYSSLSNNDFFMKKENNSYCFKDYPVHYRYSMQDSLEKNEIIISRSLAQQLQLKKDDEVDLYLYYRISSLWDEEKELYIPTLKQYDYKAIIKEVVDDDAYIIQVSYLKIEDLIQNYIGKNNKVLITNRLQLYLKSDSHFLEIKDILKNKYNIECTDLIEMANSMLVFNESTYSILKIYGVICIMVSVIFILTSLMVFNKYENIQRKLLELIGIEKRKILNLQIIQNIFPVMIALIVSSVLLVIFVPILNQYFYKQKLFYTPFMSLSQFINYDFSKVSILMYDFKFILIICLGLELVILVYKFILFQYYSKKQ